MFRQSYLGFPRELQGAALIDGANPGRTFGQVVVPNSMGIVGAIGTITVVGSWNAFRRPMLVTRNGTRTVQVTLSQFMTSQLVNHPELVAGALVAVIPVLVVFLFLQRYLVQGVESTGLRGARQLGFLSLPPSPVCSAATKASCGTSTRPTIFIRFLPSFCFSSSLRLRVMSPP